MPGPRFLFRTHSPSSSIVSIIILVCLLVFATNALAQAPEPGLANNFEIDGNLFSNNPGGVVGLGDDWLDGLLGPGVGVLNADGTPKNSGSTLHILDLIKNDDQDVFAGSAQVLEDPNTYTWKGGSVPQKDDIQNALVHFTNDGDNQWIVLSGDRRAINGNSYIDFEFLQNPLVKNNDGTFTSGGPHAGRTIGDVLLTILLTQGGAAAEFFAQQWGSDGAGGYTYNSIAFPMNAAFVAANIDSQVVTTFDAFGEMGYGVNQFGEAAVNLTALLPNFDDCFAIATMFIRTKSSASPSAVLKDFIEPIQMNKCLDTEAPTINMPPDMILTCVDASDPGTIGFAGGSDNCTQNPTVSYNDVIEPNGCDMSYYIHRTWTVTDACGNSTQGTQMITMVDTSVPIIQSAPGPLTIECGSQIPDPNPTLVIATDTCGRVTVSHVGDVTSGSPCDQTIVRTYRASDDCGNMTEVTQTIRVVDTTAPQVIGSPQDLTIQCGDETPDPDISLITASDNCGQLTVSHVQDVSDGNSCPQIITRTYQVVDPCGNATPFVQKITIEDTMAPEVEGPENVAVECGTEIPGHDISLLSASDNCGAVQVTFEGDVSDGNSCPQKITRTYRATDDCGNITDHTQIITIMDTTDPIVSDGPSDLTVECSDDVPDADINLITASDNCSNLAVTYEGQVSDGNTCAEKLTRTYRVTDDCGNSTDFTQIITIHDTTKPQITVKNNLAVECAEDVPQAYTSAVTTWDNCGYTTVVHVGDYSDGKTCPETISRVFRATDNCGNSAEATQIITIKDETAPTVTSGPGPIRIQCYAEMPDPTPGLVDASDNCSDVSVIHFGDQSDGNSCPELVTRTYRVVDECGNYTDVSQVITIHDDTPPELSSCGYNMMAHCPDLPLVFTPPTATDNCDADPAVVVTNEEIKLEPWRFTMTRTYSAVDACGNESTTCSQMISGECEGEALCSFTQGFWGNYGGSFNGQGTLEIIEGLLADSPLIVGKPGRSVRIHKNAAECVIKRLPGGTTPKALPDNLGNGNLHHSTCQTSPPLPVDSEGKFQNVLLSQTITLGLNMRYSPWMFVFPLTEKFCTRQTLAGDDGIYGTEDDEVDMNAPIKTYYIPVSVLEAMDDLGLPRLVHSLFELANRSLADWDTKGATYSSINQAVDAINNGFHECRLPVDCPEPSEPIIGRTGKGPGVGAQTIDLGPTRFELGQNYPNPFNPTTQIKISVPEATNWSLSIYNVAGQLVRRYNGTTGGAEFVNVRWDGRNATGAPVATGVYLYRVRAGSFTQVKRMVLLK